MDMQVKRYRDLPDGGDGMENSERRLAQAIVAMVETFIKDRPTMPIQYFRSFWYVALNEGKTVRELAKLTGQSPTVMSRHLLDIGDFNRHLEPGMGLITTKIDLQDRRVHRAYLTPAGKTLVTKVLQQLDKTYKR